MGLVEVRNCPTCGGADRVPASDGMASTSRDMGIHYLKHAAARLGNTVEHLVDAVQVFQCSTCRTYYCDPWISPEVASYVFTEGAPDHIAGWENFEHWLSSDSLNDAQGANHKLYRVLEKKIGTVSSYAEFGCPFLGFLLLFKAQEERPSRRMALFAGAMQRKVDVRWTKVARLHHAATSWANQLVIGYHKVRAVKESLRARKMRVASGNGSDRKDASVVSMPKTRLFLTQETTRAWSNNCVRYGGSCRYYAGRVLDAVVLPFDETVRTNRRVDLLGIFNSLDHTSDPLGVVRKGLKLARHIVIVAHHASHAGKQHQYAFDDKFPQWLATVLEGVVVEDITNQVMDEGARGNNYTLVSNVMKAPIETTGKEIFRNSKGVSP